MPFTGPMIRPFKFGSRRANFAVFFEIFRCLGGAFENS